LTRIFITGATGNVGRAVLAALATHGQSYPGLEITAAIRSGEKAPVLTDWPFIQSVLFDFEHLKNDFKAGDRVFLLRPPALANVQDTFLPFVRQAAEAGVAHIVFISVQGAEKSRFIPHHGIEDLIMKSGVPYTFLRNAYFMQNLTTTLLGDIQKRRELFVPAGKAKFNWVNVGDIGAVAAHVLLDPAPHQNKAYELTGPQNLSFEAVADLISKLLNESVAYTRPSLLRFYTSKKNEGMDRAMILVMMFLHYIPNFIAQPLISPSIEQILGRPPGTIEKFIRANSKVLKVG